MSGKQRHTLFLEPQTINSRDILGRQQLLALAEIPQGDYDSLELTATLVTEGAGEILPQNVSLPLPHLLTLAEGDSQCLFVTWHLSGCGGDVDRSGSRFSARGQGQPLSGDLLYVLSDAIGTLYLIRNDTLFVVAAIGLEGRTGEMAVDAQRQRLYLVNRSGRQLQVFDLANHRLIDRLPLPLTLQPMYLALDIKNNVAFVSDERSRQIVKIDLESGQMVANRQVGLQPGRLAYVPSQGSGLVAVCAPKTQKVVLLDADTLAEMRTFVTGLKPNHLLPVDGLLLVAEEGSQAVSVFDVAKGRNVGQVRLFGRPGELIATGLGANVYVGNPHASNLGVLGVGQRAMLRTIPVEQRPGALAISERHELIFVADVNGTTLSALNRTSEKNISEIQVGGAILDLAVYE